MPTSRLAPSYARFGVEGVSLLPGSACRSVGLAHFNDGRPKVRAKRRAKTKQSMVS